MGKLIDYDLETKTGSVMHLEERVVETIQDAEDVMYFNKTLEGKLDKKQDWWLVGSIPLTTCWEWARESGTRVFGKEWQQIAKRKLNSSEYSKLNPNRIKL